MTETEQLLKNAAEVAKRTFIDPSESAVMDIFRRLCDEIDAARQYEEISDHGKTLH